MSGGPDLFYALPARGLPGVLGRAAQMPFYLEDCAHADFRSVVAGIAETREIALQSEGLPARATCWLARAARLRPGEDVVRYLVSQPHFKYVAAYFAVFVRLTMRGPGVYALIEPLYRDPRRLIVRAPDEEGEESVRVIHMDELADALLTSRELFGVELPPLRPRRELEERGFLQSFMDVLSAPPRSDYLRGPDSSEGEWSGSSGSSDAAEE